MHVNTSRLAVVVCSVGRPDCVRHIIPALAAQSRPADRVLFVVTKPEDLNVDPATHFPPGTQAEVIISPKGLPRQRNAGLDRLEGDCELVVFFDDDFYPSQHALAGLEAAFETFGEVNGMTGVLIADGINAPGYGEEETERMVAEWDAAHPGPPDPAAIRILNQDLAGLYGCNMAYRLSAVGATRFDEALPLYAWQEDIDFAARIPGERIKTDAFAGLHRGAKAGRETSGRMLGYSQMVNTWYLWRKGTMTARFAGRLATRNFIANHLRLLRPESWIDRGARARGNWLGLWEIATGRAHPGRIETMRPS